MASETQPINQVLENEGGYAYAYGASGETYMGIDRLHHPAWPGWKLIDRYKSTVGPIRPKQVIKDEALYQLVFDFYYKKFWPSSKAGLLKNQQLANMYFDFYFHKPAIAQAALKAAAQKLNLMEAIKLANAFPVYVYAQLFKLRVLHYKNQWMNGEGRNRIYYKPGKNGSQAGVLNRAYRYPPTITDKNFISVFN